jgi:5'-nucleotidase
MRVLLTNDDGIDAPGIAAMESAVRSLGWECVIVAPATEHSMCGHRITTHSPLIVTSPGEGRFAVAGTPADCVRLGLFALAIRPDAVLAGVNAGGNLGQDIVISGTVAAAREAAYHGIRSVAMSHYLKRNLAVDWARTSRWAAAILAEIDVCREEPGHIVNVNFPHPPPDEHELPSRVWCHPELAPLGVQYRENIRSCGAREFHYTAVYNERPRQSGSDVDVCFSGHITLSRISTDGRSLL